MTSSDSLYNSSPVNSRFNSRRTEDSSESSNTEIKDDKPPRSPGSYRSRRRDWRKSPEHDRDKSNDDDKRGRWSRDRRNSFDRNRDRGGSGRWNNDGDNQRWGRDRNWNDRNNWNERNRGRFGNARDNNQMDNRTTGSSNGAVNEGGNWNSGISHWSAPPRPPMQPPQPPTSMPLPPQSYNEQLIAPPMINNEVPTPPAGNFPRIMTPNQPTNMMQMNILQNANLIQPPIPPPSHMGVVMPAQPPKPMVPSPMSMPNQPYLPSVSLPSSAPQPQPPYNPSAPADVNTLNVVNQLLLLNAERLKQATGGSGSHSSTPDNQNARNSAPASPPNVESPTLSKSLSTLPAHWKTATDADGRVYYYHTLTR